MEKTKKPFLSAIAGILALVMLAVMPAPALADTIIVKEGESIQEAILDAEPGDTVQVEPGTYTESITMKSGVTVQGSGPGEKIIDAGGSTYAVQGAPNSTISGFTIKGTSFYVIKSATMTITNNIITGSTTWTSGIYNPGSASPTITNNTITGNAYGIYNAGSASPTITNNIITGNRNYGIYSDPSASPVIEYNNVVDNEKGNYYPTTFDPPPSNISAGPMFVFVDTVDPGNNDYHLQGGSPCIDSGNNDAPELPETDADGNPRKVDDPNTEDTGSGTPPIVDMGAFEYQVAKADKANTPMDCFKVSYVKVIDRTRYGAKRDKIEIRGSFKLDDGVTFSPEDDVTVTLNEKVITIEESFKEKHFLWLHYYDFRGDIEGVRVHMHLDFNRCRWWVKIYGMEAGDLVRSETATVNVELTIGGNVGDDSFELIKRWKGRRMGFARFIEWSPEPCCGRWWWWR